MAVVDGILQPEYMVKSAVKILLFLLIPIVLSKVCKLSVTEAFRPEKAAILTGLCLGIATFGVIIGAYTLLGSYIDLSAVPRRWHKTAASPRTIFSLLRYT